ncbi:unnamed protein product, partial [Rotaria socialis]
FSSSFPRTMTPYTINKSQENQRKNQLTFPNSEVKSYVHMKEIDKNAKAANSNENYLMNDYDLDTSTTETEFEDCSLTSKSTGSSYKDTVSKPAIQSSSQPNRKKITNKKNTNTENRSNTSDCQHNEMRVKRTITINQNAPGMGRIFSQAWTSISLNKAKHQRPTSCSEKRSTTKKKDEFADWMCTWLIGQSLWSSKDYQNALLTYIGRIYGQRFQVNRIFTQLERSVEKLDELDLLYELIEKTKQRHTAKASLNKWEDNSRINRRLQDLKFIFEFNSTYKSSNHPFQVIPSNLNQIVDRQKIKSYFDLGCGDGTITAGIGDYLGLSKENIFGGDVYEGQSEQITHVKINESQSIIGLPSNRVDLITSFVTFHHIDQLETTLRELVRILRPGGYLIVREHDCKNEHALRAKYLNFVHAIMMIAKVGEFANSSSNHNTKNENASHEDYENSTDTWLTQKSSIIEYTRSIHYRTCAEWQLKFECVGFHHCATLYYGAEGSNNPQQLFYAVYQLDKRY